MKRTPDELKNHILPGDAEEGTKETPAGETAVAPGEAE